MLEGCLSLAEERLVLNAARFNFRCWDDGCVVHDHADGALYALTPAAGEVLRHLQDCPEGLTPSALSLRLLGPAEPGDEALLSSLMAPLRDLGILRVEPS
ncbi:hypothetical protein WNB94_05220 [Aquabacterium sp. A3]|uniref:hypothetical protein n=1 Tax=Aquabacterium sp. A3 TaxID=3132829 RepID=UPI00311A614D